MKSTHPKHVYNPDPKAEQEGAFKILIVPEQDMAMSQYPNGPHGCVACEGRWEGIVIPDDRGRMWHLDCALQALAGFRRVGATPVGALGDKTIGYFYEIKE